MFDVGFFELLVLGILGLFVLGPERLPAVAKTIGMWIGKARHMSRTLQRQIQTELAFEEERLARKSEAAREKPDEAADLGDHSEPNSEHQAPDLRDHSEPDVKEETPDLRDHSEPNPEHQVPDLRDHSESDVEEETPDLRDHSEPNSEHHAPNLPDHSELDLEEETPDLGDHSEPDRQDNELDEGKIDSPRTTFPV